MLLPVAVILCGKSLWLYSEPVLAKSRHTQGKPAIANSCKLLLVFVFCMYLLTLDCTHILFTIDYRSFG
jgi:hypothetical protein